MHLKTPVSFFPPASGRGKWHVKGACSDLSACGSRVVLNTSGGLRIQHEAGSPASSVHPICCRKCLKNATVS